MSPAKRNSVSSSESAAKRRKCQSVEDAITDANAYPKSVRKVLGNAVTETLGIYKDERHEFQNAIVDMIAKVLDSAEAGLKGEIASAQAKLTELTASHDALAKDDESAENDLNAKIEATKGALDAFNGSGAALKELEQASSEKTALDESSGFFEALKANGSEAGHIRETIKLAKDFQLEDILVEALSSGLKKKPDARGTFDGFAIEQLGNAVSQKVSDLAKIDFSEEALTAAKAKKDGLATAHEQAKEAEGQAKDARTKAAKALAEAKPGIKKAEDALASAQKNLTDFQEKPLASYKELVELKAPEPEVPAAAEAGVADAAAQA